ncbi:Uncharacterized protein Adt_09511 [Abeliophyllum distichum]|uniref:Uncharacterized protein n=1 Tax=Abeliophyllum distichum TaxID=126358 RepID=A0ABD1UHD7_9LAMI
MDNDRSNYGRGSSGAGGGRGRGRFGGGNIYRNQQEGQGRNGGRGRGGNHSSFTDQPSVQQQWTTRPPFQGNSGGVRGFQEFAMPNASFDHSLHDYNLHHELQEDVIFGCMASVRLFNVLFSLKW